MYRYFADKFESDLVFLLGHFSYDKKLQNVQIFVIVEVFFLEQGK